MSSDTSKYTVRTNAELLKKFRYVAQYNARSANREYRSAYEKTCRRIWKRTWQNRIWLTWYLTCNIYLSIFYCSDLSHITEHVPDYFSIIHNIFQIFWIYKIPAFADRYFFMFFCPLLVHICKDLSSFVNSLLIFNFFTKNLYTFILIGYIVQM